MKSCALYAGGLLLMLSACKTPTKIDNTYATQSFAVSCMGVDPNGIQTLRTWGNGINREKAMAQAERRAVEAVIFSGITDGSYGCEKRPILNEVNARERYEDYFNRFFSDNGPYTRFVSLEEKRCSRIKSKSSSMEAWGAVVQVDRSALKQQLINDNILK